VKKCHDRGTRVEALLIHPPRLQRATGHVQYLRGLTLGETLSLEIAIPCKQVSAFAASPALVAIIVALVCIVD
jgi:hypothetical protein